MPVDIVYGTPDELNATFYDGYARELQERLVTVYDEVRRELRRTAERNERYYDVTAKPHRNVAGDWLCRALKSRVFTLPVKELEAIFER